MAVNQPHCRSAGTPTRALAPPFAVAVEARPGGAVVRLSGELDLQGAEELAACSSELSLAGTVDIDLRAVSFLDTTGLTALVELHDGLTGRGCTVRLLGARSRVLRLLDLAMDAGWLPVPVDCPERPDWAVLSRQAAG